MIFAVRVLSVCVLVFAAVVVPAYAHEGPHDSSPYDVQLFDSVAGPSAEALAQPGTFACESGMAGPYPCQNVDMKGYLPLPTLGGPAGNDIWGWTDPQTGREYALMGTTNSTGFVDVTDPTNPILVGTLPTRGTPDYVLWRDIKVDGNYAFIVSEISNSGLQVFDLRRLRDAGTEQGAPQVFTADATYDEFSSAHNISINEETDYAYAVGTDTCGTNGENGGLHMIDISRPLEPRFSGCALVDDFATPEEPNNYVHDVECVVYSGPDRQYRGHEICFGSNENVVAIYDVTDKANPKVLSTTGYPTAAYTHQGSLTDDQRYFLFGDELDEQSNGQPTTTYVLDVADLDSPPTPKSHQHGTGSIDHNMYVNGNRVLQSNYMAGLRILEFDNASLAAGDLREVAYFDVVPGLDIAEFAGTWSNYRFPGSGNVVVSTIENAVNGLFVLDPTLPERTATKGKGGKRPRTG